MKSVTLSSALHFSCNDADAISSVLLLVVVVVISTLRRRDDLNVPHDAKIKFDQFGIGIMCAIE